MVPPIRLAFEGRRAGKSGSRLAGSSTVSETSSTGWILLVDGTGADSVDPEPSGGADTTFCEATTCPAAMLARMEPARTIPEIAHDKNRPIELPIVCSRRSIWMPFRSRKVVVLLRKRARTEGKQLALPGIISTFLCSNLREGAACPGSDGFLPA